MAKFDLYSVFFEVAKTGSFSKAAKNLFVTQSAVSQSIKRLENELDVALFTRGAKGIFLTSEGNMLLSHLEPAFQRIQLGETELKKMLILECGHLSIGAGDTISKHYLLPFLEKFHYKFPDIKIEVINRTTHEVLELLKQGKIDIGFVSTTIRDEAVDCKRCMYAHDIFVGSDAFSELKGKSLSLLELSQLPLIMLEELSSGRLYVNDFFKSNGIILKPDIELGSHDLLVSFAKAGLGIAAVTKEFCHMEGLFILKTPPIPKRNISVCYPSHRQPPVTAIKFMEFLDDDDKQTEKGK